MNLHCPHCRAERASIVRDGHYFRASDSRKIQRFRCKDCQRRFSSATSSACYRQKKRRLNPCIRSRLVDSCSQRRIALRLGISRTTVARKLIFLAEQARIRQRRRLAQHLIHHGPFTTVQFDEMFSYEHTRLKPLSIPVMVDSHTRQIIDFDVAQVPASGHQAEKSRKKYGKRDDMSVQCRDEMFQRLLTVLSPQVEISTDQHLHYRLLIKQHFPQATHRAHKSIRAAVVGQGELKRSAQDPLFRINHALTMLRDNIKRLTRRSWCNTKVQERLADLIAIFVDFLNGEYLRDWKRSG